MSDHTSISPPSPTTAPAAAKEVMPVQEQLQAELDIHPLQKTSIQFKLAIGASDDPLEHQADAMADAVMRMPEQNFIQRKCSQCEEEEKVQRKPLASFIQRKEISSGSVASDAISTQINASRGNGNGMDRSTQSFMQNRFGAEFSDVKIHTNGEAILMNRELNAKAFTAGNDIYFNEGQYNPGSSEGKHLLAHELIHTEQQRNEQQTLLIQQRHNPFSQDRIHDRLLDCYADFPGLTRDQVLQLSEGNEKRLQLSTDITTELQTLIDGATWKEIRKRVYPLESAAGIQRAKDRHSGKIPDLTGLGRLSSLDRFASAIHSIQSQWVALKTSSARLKEVGKAADVELIAAEVPAFLAVDKESMESKGFFSSSEWKYVVSKELVSKDTLDDKGAADLATTTLHESRHAEQTFLSARFSAEVNKKTAPDLALEQHIPLKIAKEAVAKKFDSSISTETRSLGSQMFQAGITDAQTNQETSDDVQASWAQLKTRRDKGIKALKKQMKGATSSTISEAEVQRDLLKVAIAEVEKKYALYRIIPYEADAHEVGDAAEQAYLGWPK
jgi:hypothetical protein